MAWLLVVAFLRRFCVGNPVAALADRAVLSQLLEPASFGKVVFASDVFLGLIPEPTTHAVRARIVRVLFVPWTLGAGASRVY
ncbi:hypothetical protein A5646_03600 [Mycobacterium sp. 1245499.0]|nr:hypothetical protein A5646_03600 [Mycobacterium sp. 1245499.0]